MISCFIVVGFSSKFIFNIFYNATVVNSTLMTIFTRSNILQHNTITIHPYLQYTSYNSHQNFISTVSKGHLFLTFEPRHAERVLNVFFSKFSFHPISKELFILNNL